MPHPDIAVVVPHFQREAGPLEAAVRSAFAQTLSDRMVVIVCDDGSPVSAKNELAALLAQHPDQLIVVEQSNAGAGAARNRAMSAIPAGVRAVAFLDSDDRWRPQHLANAMHALDLGADAYFANFLGVGHHDIGHFERLGGLPPQSNPVLDAGRRQHWLGVSALEHTVSDGGGLIGTPTVVYRYDKFSQLRFREEFYNGQDFFFWMDLSELGARYAFSYEIECECGTGVNIYQASGWGSEKSLQRLRNEMFVWTSVERFYQLPASLRHANRRTLRHLQDSLGKDLLHRLRRGKPVSMSLLLDIARMAPSTLAHTPMSMVRSVLQRSSSPGNSRDDSASGRQPR